MTDKRERVEDEKPTKEDENEEETKTEEVGPPSKKVKQEEEEEEEEESPDASKTSTVSNLDVPKVDDSKMLEERGEVSAQYVGRVIGKGGEMIRDLQARSNCRIDVDQNVPEGAPRVVTYRGTRKTIDFAKSLVAILCTEKGKESDLPLGEAIRNRVQVPSHVIGKIIGRGGEMIRELQSKSHAKIQVDHTGVNGSDPNLRQVTLTGTDASVMKAQEMIQFLISNPAMDANLALAMLLEEKNKYGNKWGSGPPYAMPNNGVGMQPSQSNYYYQQPQVVTNAPTYTYSSQVPQQAPQYTTTQASPTTIETEIFPCPKMYMGRIIGQKGMTVNDLQNRSGCDIQINQDVPPGHDCQITLRGARSGIESVKMMLHEIMELGPNHSYAGGRGSNTVIVQQPVIHQEPPRFFMPQYPPQQYYYQQQPPVYHVSVWKSAQAADGQVYYYNDKTGETQWEKPPGF